MLATAFRWLLVWLLTTGLFAQERVLRKKADHSKYKYNTSSGLLANRLERNDASVNRHNFERSKTTNLGDNNSRTALPKREVPRLVTDNSKSISSPNTKEKEPVKTEPSSHPNYNNPCQFYVDNQLYDFSKIPLIMPSVELQKTSHKKKERKDGEVSDKISYKINLCKGVDLPEKAMVRSDWPLRRPAIVAEFERAHSGGKKANYTAVLAHMKGWKIAVTRGYNERLEKGNIEARQVLKRAQFLNLHLPAFLLWTAVPNYISSMKEGLPNEVLLARLCQEQEPETDSYGFSDTQLVTQNNSRILVITYVGSGACPSTIENSIHFLRQVKFFSWLLFGASVIGLLLPLTFERTNLAVGALQASLMLGTVGCLFSDKYLSEEKQHIYIIVAVGLVITFLGFALFSKKFALCLLTLSMAFAIHWTGMYFFMIITELFVGKYSFFFGVVFFAVIIGVVIWLRSDSSEKYLFICFTSICHPFYICLSVCVYFRFFLDFTTFNKYRSFGKRDHINFENWIFQLIQLVVTIALLAYRFLALKLKPKKKPEGTISFLPSNGEGRSSFLQTFRMDDKDAAGDVMVDM